MENLKRAFDEEPKVLVPVLIRNDTNECICINKNEFKIGRGRDNDQIIMNFLISRQHCVLKCEDEDNWTIEDLSSNSTFVNNVVVGIGKVQNIYPGDIIQFTPCKRFQYVFSLIERGHYVKNQCINEEIEDKFLLEIIKNKYKSYTQTMLIAKVKELKELKKKYKKRVRELRIDLSECRRWPKATLLETQLKKLTAKLENSSISK
ncbi:uncharacterized protein LOC105199741 isoform X2 [Solenopsis invicta]|uniref:uncharacterized protein LOC105199741 isoform X2 n=1 Tax=Solenopsis invicta TaxID=13686 RepID=UPI000E33EE7D|nr:uncharacterized protein LOC105199741 isoform X2 [Solenopsis invicta]